MTHSSMPAAAIAAVDPHPRSQIALRGTHIEYVDVGSGDPIVFLHGNPTYSYLWRNIIPSVTDQGRCLAPDLVGMGGSGPAPDGLYRFTDQVGYLDAWFDTVVGDRPVTLVLHDWGSALGFHWAARHPDRVRAIAYMEGIVQPRLWSDFEAGRDQLFRAMRSPDGERMVLQENFFVEVVLPRSVLRSLSDVEMDHYRRPFRDPASRQPTLMFPRDLPIEGEPVDVAAIVEEYGAWLATSPVPKLLVVAHPGALLTGRALAFARTFPNQREVTVAGSHYVQEDSPAEIGRALRDFVMSR
ncbi:haloalkane dehalogenase [Micromonospora mangrovi]|uniref:Haloalkane dehalogenase n=2 Tax=Micromonospora TaxID=1873 RepID=A0AAU8HIY2_9ACTN